MSRICLCCESKEVVRAVGCVWNWGLVCWISSLFRSVQQTTVMLPQALLADLDALRNCSYWIRMLKVWIYTQWSDSVSLSDEVIFIVIGLCKVLLVAVLQSNINVLRTSVSLEILTSCRNDLIISCSTLLPDSSETKKTLLPLLRRKQESEIHPGPCQTGRWVGQTSNCSLPWHHLRWRDRNCERAGKAKGKRLTLLKFRV